MSVLDKLTFFTSKTTKYKNPISPFDDKTFIFETLEVDSNVSFYNTIVSHFILNIPLVKIRKPIKVSRTIKNLKQFQDKVTYFIIDIAIESEYNKNKVIDYFKPYKVILGESRSYDGYSNFNLKGIIFAEEMTYEDIKVVFADIQNDIKEYGYLNDNSINRPSLTAPILKNKVFYNNEDGIRLKKINKKLSDYITEYALNNEDIGTVESFRDISGNSIQEICLNTFSVLGYTPVKENNNGSITFSKDDNNNYFWFKNSPYIMHHPNRLKSLNIFKIIKSNKDAKNLLTTNLNYSDLLNKELGETHTFNEEKITIEGKEDIVEHFLYKRNGLLSIKSPMGTGKSTLIKSIIQQCHEQDMKVLIVTNRISVAEDFAKKYEDMKLYNKDAYNIGDSLIVQFDSLWKYNITYFDVVIMDEFTSLMLHCRNNLNNNDNNILKFFGCFNKKLIIADAFLTGYEYSIIGKTNNIVNIVNEYRDETELTSFTNKNRFIEALVKHAIDASKYGRTTSVSCTSSNMIIGLKNILSKQGLRVITLTADTPQVTKSIIYNLFESRDNNKWDVIIFSPTLTVGVSNMNNIEDHFHYDSGNSADVISSIQMIKRSRRAKNIHYYVADKNNYVCVDYNTLRDSYLNNCGQNSYLFDTDDYGELRLSKTGSRALKIDIFKNILDFNHKSAFEWLLGYHFNKKAHVINETSNSIITEYINDKKIDYISDLELLTDINFSNRNPKILEKLDDIKSALKTGINIESNKELMLGFINDYMEDSKLIQKLKYFNIFSRRLNNKELNSRLSKAILSNNKEDIVFYTNLLKMDPDFKLLSYYTPRELEGNQNKHIRSVLTNIGYKFKGNWNLDNKIQKYKDYIES